MTNAYLPVRVAPSAVFRLLGTLGLAGCALGQPPTERVSCGAGFATVLREFDSENPRGGDYFEVYAETLKHVPLIVGLTVTVRGDTEGTRASLRRSGEIWRDMFSLSIEKDGESADEYRVELDQYSDRARRYGRVTSDTLSALGSGDSVQCSGRVVGPSGSQLEPGVYRVISTVRRDAEEFFGVPVALGQAPAVRIKPRQPGDDDRYTEDLIERYYLWGLWLYEFDEQASKREFQKAWDLVQEYLRRGAGDEPGLFNITPRWQASRIAGWLDKPKKEIAYLSQFLGENENAKLAGNECRMRFYHFHRERGLLPPNVKDDLGVKLNMQFERVYGQSMSGRPLPAQPPIPKHFPESAEEDERPAAEQK